MIKSLTFLVLTNSVKTTALVGTKNRSGAKKEKWLWNQQTREISGLGGIRLFSRDLCYSANTLRILSDSAS